MALSKKLRFEVFKRDGFTCSYCGNHPPKVILEVDHIHPTSKGGTDDINNLVTSCFDCNRGKSNRELTSAPKSLTENLQVMREKEDQYKEYMKLIKNVDRRINDEIDDIQAVFQSAYPEMVFTPAFRMSVKKFLNSLGSPDVQAAMEKAISRCQGPDNTLKYFCGVCWGKIRDNE